MALSAKLELRLGQQLVMTPQLQQAIRLLQLSNLELGQFVEAELERNPLLEIDESPEAATSNGERDSEPESAHEKQNGSADEDAWLDLGKTVPDTSAPLDTDYDNVFGTDGGANPAGADTPDSGWASLRQRAGSFNGEEPNPEAFVSYEPSLRDHLNGQLPLAITDPVQRLIGHHLIDMVDEAGYLHADLEQLAAKLGAPLGMVERVLETLQTFDPPGVFARSLAECLALQLKEQNRFDPQIRALLDNLHLLATHNLAALKKAVGADAEDLADMIEEIKRLN